MNTKVLWFTGLSGSGKTTIANLLIENFRGRKISYEVFDGDEVRKRFHGHLGFTKEDIIENNRLIIELCKKFYGKVDFILVPIISPFKISRENARKEFGSNFIEIFFDCPYNECKKRDVKGHYKQAEIGELKNFIGLHIPYETPTNPEITLKTGDLSPKDAANLILDYLSK